MANALYDLGREKFLNGAIGWSSDTIKIALIDEDAGAGSVPNLTTDEFWDDRLADAKVAVSGALSGKTSTAGVADANDVTFSTVTGDPCESIDMYMDTTVDSTSPLILNIDTATGLPVTPNGGDIEVVFDAGSNKIFKL